MKKHLLALLVILMLAFMAFSITGCGISDIEGSWQLTEIQVGEESYTIEDLAELANAENAEGVSIILNIDDEGGFTLAKAGHQDADVKGTYSETDEGYLFSGEGGRDVIVTPEDGKLVLHDKSSEVESKMIFEKK